MKKIIFLLTIIFIISCKTVLPVNEENKPCLVTLINLTTSGSARSGLPPCHIELKIKGKDVDNTVNFNIRNYISKQCIKAGLFSAFTVFLQADPLSGARVDASLAYYNKYVDYELKINPNAIIIFPYKILIENTGALLLTKLKNLNEDEIKYIISNLKKDKYFNSYDNLYLGNQIIKIKNTTAYNESVGKAD